MSKRISRIVALTGVSAALAIGGAGVAQASPDHGHHNSADHCRQLHGKKKNRCEKRHQSRDKRGSHDKRRSQDKRHSSRR